MDAPQRQPGQKQRADNHLKQEGKQVDPFPEVSQEGGPRVLKRNGAL